MWKPVRETSPHATLHETLVHSDLSLLSRHCRLVLGRQRKCFLECARKVIDSVCQVVEHQSPVRTPSGLRRAKVTISVQYESIVFSHTCHCEGSLVIYTPLSAPTPSPAQCTHTPKSFGKNLLNRSWGGGG